MLEGNPFQKVTAQWLTKIKAGREGKKEFQRDADECMRFFKGPYNFMYGLKEGTPQSGDFVFVGDNQNMPKPAVAMTLNKVAEAVQIFGPTLYHRNPVRKVNPRKLPDMPVPQLTDPMMQQQYQQMMAQVQAQDDRDKARANLLQWYQDYTPMAGDLKTESRNSIDEALIKGMGVLWPQIWTPPASQMHIVTSVHRSVDHLLIDCDMESRKDAKWIAEECTLPVWEFEAKYGLPSGTVKGSSESYAAREMVEAEGGSGELARRQGKTNNLITYYEIYSKMGLGTLMSGTEWDNDSKQMDRFGQYCYLVVCKELPYPANLPQPTWTDDQAMHQALQWPTPYWADDQWPFAELVFHDVPKDVWPMSHFKPAMGELKFLNWAFSFLATRVKKSSRDLIVVSKGANEEMRRAILSGEDMELVSLEKSHGKTIQEIVEILKFPEINGDMFKVIELVTHLFEQRTGLTELMYGETAKQYRSAEEASVKQNQLHIRPDDMANKTEDWMTTISRMEALSARWHLDAQTDIAPVMGPIGAYWWQQYITPADPSELLHQIEYRVEASSMKKPNRDKEQSDADQAMQNLFQPLFQVAMQHGEIRPVNALLTIWAKAHQIPSEEILIPPPQPPPPPPPDQPKISIAMAFDELRPDLQAAIVQLAGLAPVPPPQPGPDGTPPPPTFQPGPLAAMNPKNDPALKAQEMIHQEAQHSQNLLHASEKHRNDMKIAKEKASQHPGGSK